MRALLIGSPAPVPPVRARWALPSGPSGASTLLPLALALLVVAGCAPPLQGDGFYRCARTGRCPSTAPLCGPDGFCHARVIDREDASTPPPDAPPPWAEPYRPCTGTCDRGETCHLADDGAGGTAGYCTRACAFSTDCPDFMGAPSACSSGICLRGCTGMADCRFPLVCARGQWSATGGPTRACTRFETVFTPDTYELCPPNCTTPNTCFNGRCLRTCDTDADCILTELCTASLGGGQACLTTCESTSECDDLFLPSTTCRGPPGRETCVPSSWM